jgi:hypothetical protein
MKVPKITIKSLKLPTPQTLKLLFTSKKSLHQSKTNLNFKDRSMGKNYINESANILQSKTDHQKDQD